jgi:hypothetical protein
MANTTRTSVTLTNRQLEFLRIEAERVGITVADLIRRVLDEWRAKLS